MPACRPARELNGQQRYAFAVAFSPDGSLLASGGRDGVVRVWQVSTGQMLYAIR
jgi:WD40 repeat protein